MQFVTLTAEAREATKKTGAKRIRAAGNVPAIVYGKKADPRAVAVNSLQLTKSVQDGGRLFELQVGGDTERTLLKDLQWDTFGIRLLHADFVRVSEDDRITTNIPVRFFGAANVDLQGGRLSLNVHSVQVEAPVTNIPDEIVVDLSGLTPEEAISADKLNVPEGVKVMLDDGDVVASVLVRGGAKKDEEEGEGDAAEGDAAEKKE